MKDVRIYTGSGTVGANIVFYIYDGTTAYTLDIWPLVVQGMRVIDQAFIVLEEGDELRLFNTGATGADIQVVVSGALLAGDPS